MSILSVSHLTKTFRVAKRFPGFWGTIKSFCSREYTEVHALDHISFSLDEGELVGYIGPNGAGKSTTVKLLSGILTPNDGEALVLGKTPWKHRVEVVRELGVVFGQRTQLWWDLPVIDSLTLLRHIYSLSEKAYQNTLQFLVEVLDLAPLLDVPVRQLSLGQRMRCDLAASLIHSPSILFLDEPTIGLDAVSKLAVRDCIRHLNAEKKVTILLTTHDLDDIEALCRRVLVLHKGKIYFNGTIEELRRKVAPERLLIVDLMNEKDTIFDPEARLIKQEGHRAYLSYNPLITETPKLIQRITQKHFINDLFVENPPIEEIIAKLYGSL